MSLRKQDFYEGAALYLLVRSGTIETIEYTPPFFLLNGSLLIYLKYSAKSRTPWPFTFTAEERLLLRSRSSRFAIFIGLVCGADGVVALSNDSLENLAGPTETPVRIACHRKYNEHYAVKGPNDRLDWKVAPSQWLKILTEGVKT